MGRLTIAFLQGNFVTGNSLLGLMKLANSCSALAFFGSGKSNLRISLAAVNIAPNLLASVSLLLEAARGRENFFMQATKEAARTPQADS